jgi:hypothetical protein
MTSGCQPKSEVDKCVEAFMAADIAEYPRDSKSDRLSTEAYERARCMQLWNHNQK